MKILELQEKLGITEEQVRAYAAEIGSPIPENKSIITKQVAGDIEARHKKYAPSEEVSGASEKSGIGIPPVITVKRFAEMVQKPASDIIMQLIKNGFMVNINENIDYEIVELMADELGVEVYLKDIEEEKDKYNDQTLYQMLQEDKKTGALRAPIVSVMGHVDHGKTSLLDVIRKTNVVATESGNITQTIGAYQVHVNNRDITFLDTPGHEAFIAMRRRGVHATDIAILVVAANEGVKSQTKEAISHAREAGIPIIVAITKVDLEDANVEKVKTELSEIDLIPEEWGGSTMMVEVSTKKGIGIDDLLETILLQADVLELKANTARSALGTIIESNLDVKLGKVATVLVHTGVLKLRDIVVVGGVYGRVRQLISDTGKSIEQAGPSVPVLITGLVELPDVGDMLQVVDNEREAKKMVADFKKQFQLRGNDDINTSYSGSSRDDGDKGIRIVLKGDNLGSIEAIESELKKVRTDTARIKVVRARTGNISQSDILLAQAVGGIIVGFNVDYASKEVASDVKSKKIDVKIYTIIYKLIEELTHLMIKSIEPEYEELELGVFEMKKIFLTKKDFLIIGGKVKQGNITEKTQVRIYRDGEKITEGEVVALQKGTVKVNMVEQGEECGIQFMTKEKVEEGDLFHFYKTQLKEIVLQK